jgi:hypothetical protein
MSQAASSSRQQKYAAGAARVDMKLEVALIPVSHVDRAKEFYSRLGWRLDDDIVAGNGFVSSSSRPRVRGAPSPSVRESRRRRLARSGVG